MWQWSREIVQLVVAQDHVSFFRRSAMNAVGPVVQLSVPILASVEDAVASCFADEQKTKFAVDIVVSDAYTRFWIVVPPKNVSTRRDLRLCMLLRFEELFGDSPDNWSLQADWHATRPFMASAIPLSLVNAIRTGMSSRCLSVRRCVPHFVSSIQNSYYLSTVYREVLTSQRQVLTLFGWGIGEHDRHLLQRMRNTGIQQVAISVLRNDQVYCNYAYQTIRNDLGPVQVDFFDCESPGCWIHPIPEQG
nr:DUF4917 family protein [Burkholderia ambifaria]